MICPIISKGSDIFECVKDKCEAWEPECRLSESSKDCHHPCWGDVACHWCTGFCKLIDKPIEIIAQMEALDKVEKEFNKQRMKDRVKSKKFRDDLPDVTPGDIASF